MDNTTKTKILIVDDEEALRQAFARNFEILGYTVSQAANGEEALVLLEKENFDAIISDISMPDLSGIDLLKKIRETDSDVPVLLITGVPGMQGAMQAVDLGAFQYLPKPIDLKILSSSVAKAVSLHKMARLKRSALGLLGKNANHPGDLVGLQVRFESALSNLWMAYQPIVNAHTKSVYAYEALMRSQEAALPNPGAVLEAAEKLNRLPELGRRIRALAPLPMKDCPEATLLFVNLHPQDLYDPDLMAPDSALLRMVDRIVLEVTERSSIEEIANIKNIINQLKEKGFKIAIDDLGAGYSGLNSFALLEPEYVKLDISLVSEVDKTEKKQKIIRSMVQLCKDMGIDVIAEGVETIAERDTLVDLGCDYLQGFLLAKPNKPFPAISWD